MATSKRKASAKAPAITLPEVGAKVAAAYLNGLATIREAETGQLTAILGSLEGCPAVNRERFDAEMKEKVRETLKASKRYNSDAALNFTLTALKFATVAVSNGIRPAAEETTLKLFYDGARKRAAMQGLWELPKERQPRQPKVKPIKGGTGPSPAHKQVEEGKRIKVELQPKQILEAFLQKQSITYNDQLLDSLLWVLSNKAGNFWSAIAKMRQGG